MYHSQLIQAEGSQLQDCTTGARSYEEEVNNAEVTDVHRNEEHKVWTPMVPLEGQFNVV